jgi:hypothetical protein
MTAKQRREHKLGNQVRKQLILHRKEGGVVIQDGKYTPSALSISERLKALFSTVKNALPATIATRI